MSHPHPHEDGEHGHTAGVSQREYDNAGINGVSPVSGRVFTVRLRTFDDDPLNYAKDLSGTVSSVSGKGDNTRTVDMQVSDPDGSNGYNITFGLFDTSLTFMGDRTEVGYLLPIGGGHGDGGEYTSGAAVDDLALMGAGSR
jgi:hypothetical protein